MKILGLDIGTTSIGWSIINENQSVESAGVHIFPVGVKDDDFNKSGKEVSKNIGRRMARGARRLIFRYKIRREQLKRILVEMEMMPEFTVINEKVHYLPLKAKELFESKTFSEDLIVFFGLFFLGLEDFLFLSKSV